MLKRHFKVARSTFRNLPLGTAYWLASDTASGPRVKVDRTGYLGGWTTTTGAPTITAEADKSVAVVYVPGQFTGQRGAHPN